MNKLIFLYSKVIHKLDDLIIKKVKWLSKVRRNKIKNKNFTIISNNCWGGYVYRYYGLEYNSPTIGGYFFSEDYIKFLKKLDYYLEQEIRIIETKESKWYSILKARGEESVIVGKINDIEYIFLHYKSKEEAIEKWNRRKRRINKKKLLFKFSEMNECTLELLNEFNNLKLKNKICFVKQPNPKMKNNIYYKGYEKKKEIEFDTYCWRKYINIHKLINNL